MEKDYSGYLTPKCSSCKYWLDGSTWDLGCGLNKLFDTCPYEKIKFKKGKKRNV